MRFMTNLTGALLMAGMASLSAHASALPAGEWMSSPVAPMAAPQDQAKPPAPDKTKPPKAAKQQAAPKQEENPSKEESHAQKAQQKQASKDQKAQQKQASRNEKAQEKQASRDEKAQQKQSPRDVARPSGAPQDHGQPAGRNGRIPDHDFKAHFGRQHHFAVRQVITTTRIVPNQTQFAYGGYTFLFLDPWPDDWAPADDCYIDYVGGEYVLIDLAHPGVQIALSIVG